MKRSNVFFGLLFLSINLFGEVKTLKQQAAEAYVASRPLETIKEDLDQNKLNAELQKALVPVIINKYSKLCNGRLDKVLTVDPLDHVQYIPIAFSPDSTHVLIRFQSNIAHVWNVETKETIKILKGHTDTISSVAFSPDGRYVLTGSFGGTARLWDLSTGDTIRIFTDHTHRVAVTAVAFSQCGRYVLTGSYDSKTRIWDIETGECIRVFENYAGPVCTIRCNSNNTQIVVGYTQTEYKKSQACIWNIVTGQLIKRIPVDYHVLAVALSPDNMQVLIGSWIDGKVFLWDSVTDRTVTVFDHAKWYHYLAGQYATAMAFNQDCTRVAIAYRISNGNLVYVVNLKTADIIHEVYVPVSLSSYLLSVATSSNGKYVLIGSTDRDMYLWDLGYCNTMTLAEILDIFIPLVDSQAEYSRNMVYMQFLLC